MNTSLFAHLIDRYNALSYTHHYIFGFTAEGIVYMVVTTSEVLPFVLMIDKASRGQGYSLRFKPTKTQKTYLLSMGATPLCSKKFIDEMVADSKYNYGEIFEKLVTEKYGQVWHKDTVKFTDDGDLTVDEISYQIKYEKATFVNEKFLAKFA